MEQQQDAAAIAQQSTFPPPPAYYALFRDDPSDAATPPLQPPAIPQDGEYRIFGELCTVQTGIPPLRVRQLYQTNPDGSIDFKHQLRTLTTDLVVSFLDLLHTLVHVPGESARKLEATGLIFRNLHYLLALLRPVQARATMAHMLRVQIQQRQEALEQLRQRQAAVVQVQLEAASQLAAVDWRGTTPMQS